MHNFYSKPIVACENEDSKAQSPLRVLAWADGKRQEAP